MKWSKWATIVICLAVILVGRVIERRLIARWASPEASTSPASDPIAAWQAVAKERKLYWRIDCTEISDPAYAFWGRAWLHPHGENYFVEDGGEPHWVKLGRDQREVAAKLIAAVKLPPNFQPKSMAVKTPEPQPKSCPIPLSGGPEK